MTETDNIVPVRPLDESAALDWLRSQPDGSTCLPAAVLARRWGWQPRRTSRRLAAWQKAGLVRRRGRLVMAVADDVRLSSDRTVDQSPDRTSLEGVLNTGQRIHDVWKNSPSVRRAAEAAAEAAKVIDFPTERRSIEPSGEPDEPVDELLDRRRQDDLPPPRGPGTERRASRPSSGYLADTLAYAVAISLAAVTASFSVRGMLQLFPDAGVSIVSLAVTIESSKLVGIGYLARNWRETGWGFRIVLATLVAVMAVINAAGVYGQLVASHVGRAAVNAGENHMRAVDVDSKLEMAVSRLSDLDHQIATIDNIIGGAAARGRANTALAAMEGQKKSRATLEAQRQQAAKEVAALKVERGGVAERDRIVATEAAPVLYISQLFGVDGDPEAAIRWIILAIVFCADPMSLCLCAAVSARRGTKYRRTEV